MSNTKILKKIKDENIVFVDFRFTDYYGKCHHITAPATHVDADFLSEGKGFDGSSIPGWRGIEDSDMVLMPDASSARVDPFLDEKTLILMCDVFRPHDNKPYNRCPRSIAAAATTYLKKTGIGDSVMFGSEQEFFVFDSVQFKNDMHKTGFSIRSEEGAWSSSLDLDGFNSGHRPGVKGGYFPVPPVDSLVDMRNEMCLRLCDMGMEAEVHHHEVATAGQCEIGTRGGAAVARGDDNQFLKYVVLNVAHQFGKTATFMPKPLKGDNGSGMHVHQSISKNGKNIFQGGLYGGLSQEALWYVGGILKHARALNALTNASTNSYRRLMPGFEAPVKLAYSARNRSAALRIPHSSASSRRVETRFPDSSANPYLCFAGLLLAGLDGIKNKIDPGDPCDFNLYHDSRSTDQKVRKVKEVCGSLADALVELDKDRKFLTSTGVFDDDAIDAYLELKQQEVARFRESPQPIEFEMYYSC
ncbi:type I glutamate--ammonia ligase [Candidatus Persebacteraceae bacterium Df01]|uniref:Glutamine synthetase n=1 Tax=Candidatus Doriopsillibacter californiensis TaxID=2970740 RepID=A0ABT7QLQ7_9GAMM|nr:type I glutamate--ammonia ligase [Candidatus Persebacteraceae bacterium Df01]